MASPDELAVSGNVAAGRSLLVALTESPKRLSDRRVDHNSNRRVSSPNNAVSLGIDAYELAVVKFIRPVFGEDLAEAFFLVVGHTVSRASKADSYGGDLLTVGLVYKDALLEVKSRSLTQLQFTTALPRVSQKNAIQVSPREQRGDTCSLGPSGLATLGL
jgi:hypothetical protein